MDLNGLTERQLSAGFTSRSLVFKKPGGTSRGVLAEKPCWYLTVKDGNGNMGMGECGPIWGLSPETVNGYEDQMTRVCELINDFPLLLEDGSLDAFPSIRFGLETALLDLATGGKRMPFPSPFTESADGIRINGLIWMGTKENMLVQIHEKLMSGFGCLKLKIGAINWDTELAILRGIREQYPKDQLELRVDANGAFTPDDAMRKLETLAKLDIHSIEQPIKAGQWDVLAHLCLNTPIPIALDEELVGLNGAERHELLDALKPQYIILKPSLLGGFTASEDWIAMAEARNIGWWVTSMLESNVGLNAIAQWTYTLNNPMPQGLGTGQLFTNNPASPLYLEGEWLKYDAAGKWDTL